MEEFCELQFSVVAVSKPHEKKKKLFPDTEKANKLDTKLARSTRIREQHRCASQNHVHA